MAVCLGAVCLGAVTSVAAHVMLAAVGQERRPTAFSKGSWTDSWMNSWMDSRTSGTISSSLKPDSWTDSRMDSSIFSSSSWGLGASHRRDASSQVVERSLERHDGGLQRRDMPAMAWAPVAGSVAAA